MVRASFMMREHALADRPKRSMIRSSRSLQSSDNGQYFSICLLLMAELQNTFLSGSVVNSFSSANLFILISRALWTRAATVAVFSAGLLFTRFFASTLETQSCTSILSMIGPESLER